MNSEAQQRTEHQGSRARGAAALCGVGLTLAPQVRLCEARDWHDCGGQGWGSSPPSGPTRGLRKRCEPEEVQPLFHSLGLRFPNSKGQPVRDRGKGVGLVPFPLRKDPGAAQGSQTKDARARLEPAVPGRISSARVCARRRRGGRGEGPQPSTSANRQRGRLGGGAGASL